MLREFNSVVGFYSQNSSFVDQYMKSIIGPFMNAAIEKACANSVVIFLKKSSIFGAPETV